jgi:hypothetical protein
MVRSLDYRGAPERCFNVADSGLTHKLDLVDRACFVSLSKKKSFIILETMLKSCHCA